MMCEVDDVAQHRFDLSMRVGRSVLYVVRGGGELEKGAVGQYRRMRLVLLWVSEPVFPSRFRRLLLRVTGQRKQSASRDEFSLPVRLGFPRQRKEE